MPRPSTQPRPLPDGAEWRRLHCSFCGKEADHVRFLTAGVAGGMICDVCGLKAFLIFARAYVMSAVGLTAR